MTLVSLCLPLTAPSRSSPSRQPGSTGPHLSRFSSSGLQQSKQQQWKGQTATGPAITSAWAAAETTSQTVRSDTTTTVRVIQCTESVFKLRMSFNRNLKISNYDSELKIDVEKLLPYLSMYNMLSCI